MTRKELLNKIKNGYKPTSQDYFDVKSKEEKEEYLAKKELYEINNWFIENDWKANKIVTKEWLESDQRWIDYLNERKVKRARQDELKLILNK